MSFGVRELPSWINPAFTTIEWGDWPTLKEDHDSIQRNKLFIECAGNPRVEMDVDVRRESRTVTIGWSNWTVPRTCSGAAISKVELCWNVGYKIGIRPIGVRQGCTPLGGTSPIELQVRSVYSITLQVRSYPDPDANPYTQAVYRWAKGEN